MANTKRVRLDVAEGSPASLCTHLLTNLIALILTGYFPSGPLNPKFKNIKVARKGKNFVT